MINLKLKKYLFMLTTMSCKYNHITVEQAIIKVRVLTVSRECNKNHKKKHKFKLIITIDIALIISLLKLT